MTFDLGKTKPIGVILSFLILQEVKIRSIIVFAYYNEMEKRYEAVFKKFHQIPVFAG